MSRPRNSGNPEKRQAHHAAMYKKRMRCRKMLAAGLAAVVILLAVLLVKRTDIQNGSTVPVDRELTANQYFVFDCSSNSFLTIAETPETRIYPASITKLLTACVALQYLQPDEVITAGNELTMVAAGSSVADLEQGDTLTASQLIGGMILPSGNDAAHVLAAHVGRMILNEPSASSEAAVAAFVEQMNAHARQTGLADTHFANPDGIHKEDHFTTYQDLVNMAQQALQNKSLMTYCGTGNATVQTGNRELQWHNTNLLVDPESDYYCPYAIGLKTGQTPYAGSCLLSAFDLESRTLIVGVFDCPDAESRFADTLQLINPYLPSAY